MYIVICNNIYCNNKAISDHAAITAVTHIKRLPKDNFVKTRDVHKTWFDVGSAVRELNEGKESINDLSFDQLVEGTMGKIKNHLYILPKKKKKTQKPWFSQFLVEAREHMFLMKRTGSHLRYQLARTSFHYFCKQAQQSYRIDKVEQVLRKPKGKQYLDIFQTYKKTKDKACTIDLDVFFPYSKKLFEKGTTETTQGDITQDNGEEEKFGSILEEITEEEIVYVFRKIYKQSQKLPKGIQWNQTLIYAR